MRNSLKLDGPVKTYLDENELPKAWYNVRADMKKKPAPLLNPGTGKPVTFEDLQPVFCDELIKQELDNDTRFFEIPEDILTFYKMYSAPTSWNRRSALRRTSTTSSKATTPRAPTS